MDVGAPRAPDGLGFPSQAVVDEGTIVANMVADGGMVGPACRSAQKRAYGVAASPPSAPPSASTGAAPILQLSSSMWPSHCSAQQAP